MNAESVKARLKNFAKDTGHTFQEALTYYGLERTIYRISVSEYAEYFVLKGGIFLYAIFDRNYERATTDIDFLARRITNSSKEMKTIFQKILCQEIDDALVFDSNSITVEDIIHNGYLNSRYKDFYDIYVLQAKYNFSFRELKNAVIETFENRKTPMSMDSAAFGDEFLNDPMHQARWKSFLKKKKALIQISMNEAMDRIKTFVRPLLDDTAVGGTNWNPDIDC